MTKNSKQNMANLQNEEQSHILDAIDEMRDLGVNEDISIPQVLSHAHPPEVSKNVSEKCTNQAQIVVVGDQSSGKSSTLQVITHMPLAVDSELCTRFATQIFL
jgi:polynucleotide 5'-kinase involved in rRNA processing